MATGAAFPMLSLLLPLSGVPLARVPEALAAAAVGGTGIAANRKCSRAVVAWRSELMSAARLLMPQKPMVATTTDKMGECHLSVRKRLC